MSILVGSLYAKDVSVLFILDGLISGLGFMAGPDTNFFHDRPEQKLSTVLNGVWTVPKSKYFCLIH